jgi:tetratricopeptide (TPR) repeat protein
VSIQHGSAHTSLLTPYHRYLYEVGDYTTCLTLVETASAACDDKNSPRYANLRNTAGTCYFDMNRLQDCRRDYEIALAIQENELHEAKIAYMYHNMGNLETGCGKFEEAMEYFTKAANIRRSLGDRAAGQLALTYLSISRLYYFRGMYDEAMKMLESSEALFVRTQGADTHFMALWVPKNLNTFT